MFHWNDVHPPASPEIAAGTGRLRRLPGHRDPFDRLLVWTALEEGFTLVSGDEALPGYPDERLKL